LKKKVQHKKDKNGPIFYFPLFFENSKDEKMPSCLTHQNERLFGGFFLTGRLLSGMVPL